MNWPKVLASIPNANWTPLQVFQEGFKELVMSIKAKGCTHEVWGVEEQGKLIILHTPGGESQMTVTAEQVEVDGLQSTGERVYEWVEVVHQYHMAGAAR